MIGTLLENAVAEVYPGPPERKKVTLRIQPDPETYHGVTYTPVPSTVECWDGDADLTAHLLTGDKVTLGEYMRWKWHQRFEVPGDDYGNRVISAGVADYSRPLP
jgi:hypothetical protein